MSKHIKHRAGRCAANKDASRKRVPRFKVPASRNLGTGLGVSSPKKHKFSQSQFKMHSNLNKFLNQRGALQVKHNPNNVAKKKHK